MSIMKFFKKLRFNKGGEKKKCSTEKRCSECDEWGIISEEGREVIQIWRNKRQRMNGARKSYHEFLVYSLTLDTLKSFSQNINLMVIIQIIMALTSVYIFQVCDVSFNLPVPVLVSPIVFPLAFSINTDFQRREKVLEDLAVFKSSGMIWFFCMREWKEPAGLTTDWIQAVHGKLKSLLFHLREYLLTYKLERRKIILRAMYEDFSDANQLIEKVRASALPANAAVVSKSIQLLNMMCLSFERLRVIREYRSPRSIRSFNKVFIMFLPIFLAPYFLYLGIQSNNKWEPYYISALVAFVFSSLQSVQDKLDDPFGGMSEDDINLDTIDEWTFSSLEHTAQRSFDIGRFKVKVTDDQAAKAENEKRRKPSLRFATKPKAETSSSKKSFRGRCRSTTLPSCGAFNSNPSSPTTDPRTAMSLKKARAEFVKLAPKLESVKGNARINRRSEIERPIFDDDDIKEDGAGDARKIIGLKKIFESIVEEEDGIEEECVANNDNVDSANTDINSTVMNEPTPITHDSPSHFLELTTVLSNSNGDPILIRRESIDRGLYKLNSSGVSNASYLHSIFSPDADTEIVNEAPNQVLDKINNTDNIMTSSPPRKFPITQSPIRYRSRGSSSESNHRTRFGIDRSDIINAGESKSAGNSPNMNKSIFAVRRARVNSSNLRGAQNVNDSPADTRQYNSSPYSNEPLYIPRIRLQSLESRTKDNHRMYNESPRSRTNPMEPKEDIHTDNSSTRFIKVNELENTNDIESRGNIRPRLDSMSENNCHNKEPLSTSDDDDDDTPGICFEVNNFKPPNAENNNNNISGNDSNIYRHQKPSRFTVFSNRNALTKETHGIENTAAGQVEDDLVIGVIPPECRDGENKRHVLHGHEEECRVESDQQLSPNSSLPFCRDSYIDVDAQHYMDMYR